MIYTTTITSLFRSMSLWSWLVVCCPRHPERKSFLPGFSNGWKIHQPRKTEMSTDCRYSTLTVEMPLPLVLGILVAAEYKTMSKMSLIDGRLGWPPASRQKMRAPNTHKSRRDGHHGEWINIFWFLGTYRYRVYSKTSGYIRHITDRPLYMWKHMCTIFICFTHIIFMYTPNVMHPIIMPPDMASKSDSNRIILLLGVRRLRTAKKTLGRWTTNQRSPSSSSILEVTKIHKVSFLQRQFERSFETPFNGIVM